MTQRTNQSRAITVIQFSFSLYSLKSISLFKNICSFLKTYQDAAWLKTSCIITFCITKFVWEIERDNLGKFIDKSISDLSTHLIPLFMIWNNYLRVRSNCFMNRHSSVDGFNFVLHFSYPLIFFIKDRFQMNVKLFLSLTILAI